MPEPLIAMLCGFVIALVTTPVGVSRAVFLLPVQLDLLKVPNPSVTPTNLLYNVVSGPGALLRHRARLRSSLVGKLLCGTVPGVVVGACVRVWLVPDARTFRLVAAVVLLALGSWLVVRTLRQGTEGSGVGPPRSPGLVALSFAVGAVGGVYGIGGGSILGRSRSVRSCARQASTGALALGLSRPWHGASTSRHRLGADGSIAPDWTTGLGRWRGGLVGGYLGARWSHLAPERALRLLLGAVAIALAATYFVLGLR